MRISTAGFHSAALEAMLTQQATLSRTQVQVASGRRVQTPADDPVAAAHLLELQRALDESAQFGRNSDVAENRLALEEQALADATLILDRVRELTIQANTATVDAASRRMIATEVRGRLQDLVDIGNRQDANGEYLFSGFSTLTQPFARTGSVVAYGGDQGNRSLQIGPTQRVADSHSGFDVFMSVPQGNGTFVSSAASSNTGTALIQTSSVTDLGAWVADDYTLSFTSATAWQVVDSTSAVVASGTYSDPGAIAFRGISLNVAGTPGVGDSFAIEASASEDMFATMNRLISALEQAGPSPAAAAQYNMTMGSLLQQLDQGSNHLLEVRAEVGTRLSMVETTAAARDDQEVELQRVRSDLRDIDYAEAITRMNQQLAGLQAAQASYGRISQLTLFDYL